MQGSIFICAFPDCDELFDIVWICKTIQREEESDDIGVVKIGYPYLTLCKDRDRVKLSTDYDECNVTMNLRMMEQW